MPPPNQDDLAQYKTYLIHRNKSSGSLYLKVGTPTRYKFRPE